MSKTPANPDVVVLGEHPAAYLAATALRAASGKSRVVHATIPGERVVDRLVTINPEFFDLHKSLSTLQKKMDLGSVHGLRFLSNDPGTSSEFRNKTPMAYVAHYKDVRAAVMKVAEDAGVELLTPKTLEIDSADEQGVHLTLGGKTQFHPKALIVAGTLPTAQQQVLGLPDSWGEDVVHRYSFILTTGCKLDPADAAKPIQPMSLDIDSQLCWAWLFTKGDECQLAIEQPVESVAKLPPAKLLKMWADVLVKHGVLKAPFNVTESAIQSMDLPLAGALAHEGVANRTLLVGPAGGFYSATGEDIYPNAWSAIFAADVLKKALKEKHLQDAINAYRQVWRTTLGDYLRGPQQNLRFLLPLIYRNQVMTERLTESILLGKSVVR
jgi:flavin-dependent dehydrogenase